MSAPPGLPERVAHTESRVSALETSIEALTETTQSGFRELRTTLSGMSREIAGSRATNWGVVYSGLGVVVAMLMALGAIVGLPIFQRQDYLGREIERTQRGFAESLRDEREMHRLTLELVSGRLDQRQDYQATAMKSVADAQTTLSEAIAALIETGARSDERLKEADRTRAVSESNREKLASLDQMFREVETQFRWATDVAAMRAAYQERIAALLWRRVFGDELPSPPVIYGGPNGQ